MPTRIPGTVSLFNAYINTNDIYLAAGTPVNNGTRLGLTSQNISDWNTRRVYWRDVLYPKYSDPNQSTSAVKEEVQNFIADFKTFAQPLLDIMATSPNAVEADAHTFNFVIGHKDPTIPTTPIADGVVFEAKPIGGGDLKFSCRTSHDDHRASKAEGSDSVQLAFVILDLGSNPGAGVTAGPGTPGATEGIPTAADKNMTKEIFTKSQFTFHCGAENVGKRIIVFARWYNTKHPTLAGPWSAITVVVIA